ncbi:hypothetical protein [Arthrobacter sp. zg-Y1110]|uniref:hypothetical protein n=1 Tax=Arthrobacter sp. zg-Y1110 TaxID=2886932 RepID=UPI001D139387|nr:hypothetical protein [Arthrobacter sp. zg-Y1110]MCC3292962.1 hypothetical protein [Arthrobacter sp. zg-Y1110]UWX86901.1 hypothetical protein N2K99_18835 [Arthrobacter sp. zg-Y1110]
MTINDTTPDGAQPLHREVKDAAGLDALTQGSIAIILNSADDKWPEAFLRYGSGWTLLEAGTDSNNIPSAGLLIRPEQTVIIIVDADKDGQGRAITTEEELLALPEGSLVRGLGIRHNPSWPKLLRRVYSYSGNEFFGSSPDHNHDPIPVGAAVRYYGDLTVIWEPAAAKEMP